MKKRLLASLCMALCSVIIGLNSSVVTAASMPVTYITGYVFAPEGDPYNVAGLKVSITCLDYDTGKYYGSGYDIADADGSYLIALLAEKCPANSMLLGGAGDDTGRLHYGHGRNFVSFAINSKLTIYTGDIGMMW